MNTRSNSSLCVVGSVMALLWAQTSAAKQAEVMTFDGQAVEAVIDVGPRMRGMPTDGTPPVPSMEAVLGNDFRSFGSPVMEPQEEAISTSHISVPLWMQTGQVSGSWPGSDVRYGKLSLHPTGLLNHTLPSTRRFSRLARSSAGSILPLDPGRGVRSWCASRAFRCTGGPGKPL